MHYSAEPCETLHDLLGAGGPSIHWPRVLNFLAALLVADLIPLLLSPLLRGGGFPSARDFFMELMLDLVVAAASLGAFRLISNGVLAAALAAVGYTVVGVPIVFFNILSFTGMQDLPWAFFLTIAVFGLTYNFLFLAGLHAAVRFIPSLLVALLVGAAGANLVHMLLRTAFQAATGDQPFHLGPTLGIAVVRIGAGALFGVVLWAGLKLPIMQMAGRAAAATMIGAGVTDATADLQRAADSRSVRKRLKPAAIGSIIFGVIAIGLGIASLEDSALNAFLVLLGFFLLGEGIWLLVQPTPVGMIVDGIALCLLGLWNLLVTVANMQSGAGGFRGFAVLGIFQIIMGIQSFRRYGRFAHLAGGTASAEAIQRVDALVAGIATASMKTSADIIEFAAGGQPWKGRLAPDLAVFVAGAEEEVVLAGKSEVTIAPQEPVAGKSFAALFQLGPHSHKGSLSPEAYQRYEIWRSSR
ncbi:MAG: hypothetical protein ACRD4T_04420 [Candidatus Acidiferrales bacterium]